MWVGGVGKERGEACSVHPRSFRLLSEEQTIEQIVHYSVSKSLKFLLLQLMNFTKCAHI